MLCHHEKTTSSFANCKMFAVPYITQNMVISTPSGTAFSYVQRNVYHCFNRKSRFSWNS